MINWLNTNNLSINLSKTKVIQFQTYINKPLVLNIKYKDTLIEEVESAVFLGIMLDKYCNWKEHVEGLCKKLDRFVYVINKIRLTVSKEAACSAYHGYVSSLLRYGIILWGNSVDVEKVFRIQKKCIRSLCGANYLDSCKPLFKKMRILPLPSLYIYEMCLFVKRNYTLFDSNSSNINIRGRTKYKLCIPKQRLTLYQKNAFCMAIKIYNKLSEDMTKLPINTFKRKLFDYLLNQCFYSVNEFLTRVINV